MPSHALRMVLALASGAGLLAAASPSVASPPMLRFVRDGSLVRSVSLLDLRAGCHTGEIAVDDPYYLEAKRFHALPLPCVLGLGFGMPLQVLAQQGFFLRARDGYTRPAQGELLLRCCAHLAFSDAVLVPDAGSAAREARWAPIDRRQVDPAPFYLVWSAKDQNDPHRFPWPYQLAEIEIAPFEREYPHTEPRGAAPDSLVRRGFAIFRRECVACHSINGEGGKVGPDLNVPRSIVEYRPDAQIRAYIRDPQSFRYTSMPAHPHLSDADLEGLLEYFRAMSRLKHDPGA